MPFSMSFRALALIVALSANLSLAGTIFSDGTFTPLAWTTVQEVGIGSVVISRVETGGNPDQYLRVDHQNFTGVLAAYHYRTGATYDPSWQGAIATVAWSLDEIAIMNLDTTSVAAGGALGQNGKNYYSVAPNNITKESWDTFGLSGLSAASFRTFADGNDHPDFSTSGAPITFGIWTASDNGARTDPRAAGLDNWSFEITAVPEPSSLLILGAGLAGVGALALRRKRRA